MSLIEREPNTIIKTWFIAIITIYTTITIIGVVQSTNQKEIAKIKHDERISPYKNEHGKTEAKWDNELLKKSNPIKVTSGIYVERIVDLSIPDASWVADFYIWFRWKNRPVTSDCPFKDDEKIKSGRALVNKKLRPGNTFQVVDGEILKQELIKTNSNNNSCYELYHVKAKITKFFNSARFPRDDHLLTLRIEDKEHQIYKLRYIPDKKDSEISSRVKLHGYKVYKDELVRKPHSYKTGRGDVRLNDTYKETFSQLIYGISIKRPGWGNYIKMFEGLFSAVAVALLSFFIRTTTTNRISLGVGAFFATVAATYVASRNLPNIGILTLTDVITGIAMLTVFLVIWHTIIATRLYELHKQDTMVHRFDMYGFILFVVCFVVTNAALVVAASIWPEASTPNPAMLMTTSS